MRIVTRAEWGARYGRGTAVRGPLAEVVIHTEAGAVLPEDWQYLNGLPDLPEKQHMQAVERYHSVNRGWNGIGYSFFLDWDGTIFEGRGWLRSGAHTETRNYTAHAICFRGHGDLQPATEQQWASAAWLIREGVRVGAVTKNPKISGHRNYSRKGKSCPGNLIYPHIGRLRGITGPHVPKGWLMALSDQKQQELYDMVSDLHGVFVRHREQRHGDHQAHLHDLATPILTTNHLIVEDHKP